MTVTITVTGSAAAAIEAANHASFYGINKLWPSHPACTAGRNAARAAVKAWLEDHGINWNSFDLLCARTIDTAGSKAPYKAEIDFSYD